MKTIDNIRLRLVENLFKEKFPELPGILLNIITVLYYFIVVKDIFKYNYILSFFFYKQEKHIIKSSTEIIYVDHRMDHYELTKLHLNINKLDVITFNKLFFVFEKTYPYFITHHLNKNIKILHIGTIEFLSLFNFEYIAKKCKQKNIFLIVTYHNFGHDDENYEMLKLCDLIITLSDKFKEILNVKGLNNVIVNYLPSSFSTIKSTEKHDAIYKMGLNHNKIIFSLIGTVREDKGYEFFINAIMKLEQNYKDKIFLNFAGKIIDNSFERISKLLPKSSIEYRLDVSTKFISDEEFIENIVASDALIIPYTRETLNASGPMMDGANRKVPIIGTDNGDIGYTINKWKIGITFKHKDEEDLRNKIIEFIERKNELNFNFEKFIEDHSAENFSKKHQTIYTNILENDFFIENYN